MTDSAGRTGSHNATVTVATGDPNVIATASPTSPTPGTPVNFNSDATTYYSGSLPPSFPVSFAWSFGDGGTSTLADPSHTYLGIGTYGVTLSVTDNKGRTGVGTVSVNVVAVTPPPPPLSPTASFTFGPPAPTHGVTSVLFDGNGSKNSAGGSTGLTYTWNFGDGIISATTASPTINHTYAAAGSYAATLRVTDTVTGLSNTSAPQTVPVN